MFRDQLTFTLLGLICVAGCGSSGEHGLSESIAGWTSSSGSGVPGIDEASVTMVTLKGGPPDGIPFVVWSDLPNPSVAQGSSNANRASYRGSHRGTNGRRVEFQCAISDGNVTDIMIARRKYDLANGSLFLVSTKQNPPLVAQFDVDVQNFPRDKEGLKQLSRAQPDIGGFFKKCHAATLDPE